MAEPSIFGSSCSAPPTTFTAPFSASEKSPAVTAVTPKSTSPEAMATAMGCAAWKNLNCTSSPASLKYPRSKAMKLGECEVKRSAPTTILSAARAVAANSPAPASAAAASERKRFLLMIMAMPPCVWSVLQTIAQARLMPSINAVR